MSLPTKDEVIAGMADEYASAIETIEVLEGLIDGLLVHAKNGASLYEANGNPGHWYFLWQTDRGGIGHEDLSPLLKRFLTP